MLINETGRGETGKVEPCQLTLGRFREASGKEGGAWLADGTDVGHGRKHLTILYRQF